MLLVAGHVLGDVDRWWLDHGHDGAVPDTVELGDVFRLVYRASVEAEAGWSLLDEVGNGFRVFTTLSTLLPISLLLTERDGNLIVWDVRFPLQER